jgi:predicted helicase
MRDHLLHAFDQIWIDNLHGNRLISERAPNGRTCETIFKRAGHSVGIKVGTAIGCMAKRGCSAERSLAEVSYRDVWGRPGTDESWGRAEEKRAALVESLAAADFAGLYQDVTPRRETRWVLIPGVSAPDYASWPALPDVFPIYFSGVNTNRDADLVSVDRASLEARMRTYYDANKSDEGVKAVCPVLMTDAARFNAAETRAMLLKRSRFGPAHIVRTVYRPLDDRWLYYEPLGKLLNEKRHEYSGQVWERNCFLATTNRQTYPGHWSSLNVSGHVVLYESLLGRARVFSLRRRATEFGQLVEAPNVSDSILSALCAKWGVALRSDGELTDQARAIAEELFYHAVAILQSPAYRAENAGDLRQNWPRVPIPQERDLLAASAALGRQVADLLQSEVPVARVTTGDIRPGFARLGIPSRTGGKPLTEADLAVTIRYSATGRWETRTYRDEEQPDAEASALLGKRTGDLWWNDVGCWANVPAAVWGFTIGGYPVLKKWLTYRHEGALGRPLSLEEVNHVTATIRRVAALLLLGPALDVNFRAAAATSGSRSTA